MFFSQANEQPPADLPQGKLLSFQTDSICYTNGKKVNEGDDFKVSFPFDSRVKKITDGTAKVLSERRRELGLTMKAVAEKAGVCERTVEKYENGMIKDERCNLEVLIALARALEIDQGSC